MTIEDVLFFLIVPIGGVVIGAIAVYFSSLKILEKGQNLKKRNIAKAFLLEIKAIEKKLNLTINDKFLENNENPNILSLEIHAINKLHFHYPFYDNYDLFSTSRMSIYILNENLCEEMNIFYDNLCISDDRRKELMEKINKKSNDDVIGTIKSYKETINAVKHTFKSVENIKKELEEIIFLSQDPPNIFRLFRRN